MHHLLTINFVPGVEIIGKEFCEEFNKNCILTKYKTEEIIDYLTNISDKDLNYKNELLNVQKTISGLGNRQTVEQVLKNYE